MLHIKMEIIGHAENQSVKSANRIQCFMLSSILSNNRDVVSLVPVQQMT